MLFPVSHWYLLLIIRKHFNKLGFAHFFLQECHVCGPEHKIKQIKWLASKPKQHAKNLEKKGWHCKNRSESQSQGKGGGVTGLSGSMNICICEHRWSKDTRNLTCEDRRLQNCLVLKTEDLATKPEDWRFEFLTGKIWLLSVINWEGGSWWYLPQKWIT